jgi:hypothetical protein
MLDFLDQRPAPGDFHWTLNEEEVFTELQRQWRWSASIAIPRIANYKKTTASQIRSILERTMHGNRYDLGREFGGAPSYLSDVDTLLFRRLVEERIGPFDSIRTFGALYWLQEVRKIRILRTRRIAELMGCNHLLRNPTKSTSTCVFDGFTDFPNDTHSIFDRLKASRRSAGRIVTRRRLRISVTKPARTCQTFQNSLLIWMKHLILSIANINV